MSYDFVIVGAGLSGATVARVLTDAGKKVLVVERRKVVGGNCRDSRHRSGIMFNLHGPHYFRTNSERIWKFANRFANFRPWAAEVMIRVDYKLRPWPLRREDIGDFVEKTRLSTNFEEAMLAQLPRELYASHVCGYTQKQWGTDPRNLDTSLAGRVDIRADSDDRRLKTHKFQGLPVGGYTHWIMSMLDGIDVRCDQDGRGYLHEAPRVVYTGSIDEFFAHRLGHLRYRTQRREYMYRADVAQYQPCVQVNLPADNTRAIRVIEWKHMIAPDKRPKFGTLLTWEYPGNAVSPDENEYPYPDARNRSLYFGYTELAQRYPNVTFVGRLGRYQYLDMDQAIGAALKTATSLVEGAKLASAA